MEKKERSLIFSYVFFLPLLVVDGYRVVAVFCFADVTTLSGTCDCREVLFSCSWFPQGMHSLETKKEEEPE